MIGTIVGILVGIGVIASAASGQLQVWPIGGAIVLVLIGFLIPRTIGMMLTMVALLSLVAFVFGLLTGLFSSAWAALAIGVICFVGQFLIGTVRRDAT